MSMCGVSGGLVSVGAVLYGELYIHNNGNKN